MDGELLISKLDAAKRQLETAIQLFFRHGDPVSIHTLTAASYNVISNINDSRGGGPMIVKGQLMDQVRPEAKELFRKKLNESENFFKHADRDPESALTFSPAETEMLIVDACSKYFQLTKEDSPFFVVFRGWYMANHPDLFILPDEQVRALQISGPSFAAMGRPEYLRRMLPALLLSQ